MDVSQIGEPYQHLGNHPGVVSTPSRGAVIIAPGQQDARNRSRKKNAGAKSSKNKEIGGDAFTHSTIKQQHLYITSIFKQDYWLACDFTKKAWKYIHQNSGFGGQRVCYAHPALIHHLG